jgi:hypothetical protein
MWVIEMRLTLQTDRLVDPRPLVAPVLPLRFGGEAPGVTPVLGVSTG